MIFSRLAIKRAIQQGKVIIHPFAEEQVEAAHINLHLHVSGKIKLLVRPKSFITARTVEKVTLSQDMCGFMEGRASLARQGISVEQSSTSWSPVRTIT